MGVLQRFNSFVEQGIQFWGNARSPSLLGWVRVLLGIATLAMLVLSMLEFSQVLGPSGVLAIDRLGASMDRGVPYRVSLFWLSESRLLAYLYLGSTFLCVLASILGVGGRIVSFACWFLVVGIGNRWLFLQDVGFPLLASGWMYLVVDHGRLSNRGIGKPWPSDSSNRWTVSIALRLIQVHVWLWLIASLFSQMASFIWWRGEAVWFLAVSERSWLSTDYLLDREWLVNCLTHGLILTQLVAVVLFANIATRRVAAISACCFWLGIAILAGEWLYGLIGFSMTISWFESNGLSRANN